MARILHAVESGAQSKSERCMGDSVPEGRAAHHVAAGVWRRAPTHSLSCEQSGRLTKVSHRGSARECVGTLQVPTLSFSLARSRALSHSLSASKLRNGALQACDPAWDLARDPTIDPSWFPTWEPATVPVWDLIVDPTWFLTWAQAVALARDLTMDPTWYPTWTPARGPTDRLSAMSEDHTAASPGLPRS